MAAPIRPLKAAPRRPSALDAVGRNWPGVSVVLALAILASGYFGLVHPVFAAFRDGGKYDVDAKRAALGEREAKLTELEALQRQFAALSRTDTERLERFLPSEADVPAVITALEELSRLAGLQMLAVDTNPRKDSIAGLPSVGGTDVAVSLAGGDYPKLKAFVRNLEGSLRLFDVTAVAFQQSGAYSLNLRTYHLLAR
ncbi:hypothetical protein EPO33_00270 [Patescibacteria group bacterium]|nr:MAG: hypothetical protein EPO33_00270 [Patescibacteria group bacterium]